MKAPNTREQQIKMEKENNWIMKINSGVKLNGLYPAIKKVAEFKGYKDSWDVYFIAAKQYHSLLETSLIFNIKTDTRNGKIKNSYFDSFGREVRIFKTEKSAIKYLSN